MKTLRVIIKKPHEEAYATTITAKLEEYQNIVGGYIEVVPFGISHLLIINEEGKLIRLKPNIIWNNDIIMGTIILVRDEAPEFGSILPEEEKWMIQMLNRASV